MHILLKDLERVIHSQMWGLCWKRFRLKPEALRNPLLAQNKIPWWAICPSFWLTGGKITNGCGFLASVAGIPPSFHQECFLSSLLRVCLEKETNVLQEKSFFVAQLLLYYYVCVRFISSLKDYRYCVFPLIASCFHNLGSKVVIYPRL